MIKRIFDILVGFFFLIITLPLFVLISLLIWLIDGSPVYFKQQRIGLRGRPFLILKFRSMSDVSSGLQITTLQDRRVTNIGRIIRSLKIDELPQLINVLKGEMSIVGPRPEVIEYVDRYPDEFDEVHQVRPGITGLSQLGFSNEEQLLSEAEDVEKEYVENILPAKIKLDIEYVKRESVYFDMCIILQTFALIFKKVFWDR